VLNDFGSLGRAYCEASEDQSDLQTTISDLISGQYDNPVSVVAFTTSDSWSKDVSEDIAREIMRRLGLAGDALPSSLEASSTSISARIAGLRCGSPDRYRSLR
jgi:hypothetical protein